jgi:hypothetical protein
LSSNIFKNCKALNRQQVLGLCALICIAQRESTPIFYQWEEYGFGDVPLTLVNEVDDLTEEEQIELVATVVAEPGSENTDKAVYIA